MAQRKAKNKKKPKVKTWTAHVMGGGPDAKKEIGAVAKKIIKRLNEIYPF